MTKAAAVTAMLDARERQERQAEEDDPQADIFRPTTVLSTPGADTKHVAHRKAQPKKNGLHALILALLREHGPLTRKELAALGRFPENTANPRCAELLADDVIEVCGAKDGCSLLRIPV